MRTRLEAIVALSHPHHIIGTTSGEIPWHSKLDFQHFKFHTEGKVLIMGRKTYESLPGPLPGRTIVVLSRSATLSEPGENVHWTRSPAEALSTARTLGQPIICGGAEIYNLFSTTITHWLISWIDWEPHPSRDYTVLRPDLTEFKLSYSVEAPGCNFSFWRYQL